MTQRRWLAFCNPPLRQLITKKLGNDDWILHLDNLRGLAKFADDPEFQVRACATAASGLGAPAERRAVRAPRLVCDTSTQVVQQDAPASYPYCALFPATTACPQDVTIASVYLAAPSLLNHNACNPHPYGLRLL